MRSAPAFVVVAAICAAAAPARADDKQPVWLGITYMPQGGIGIRVTEVHEETGAEAAGLKAGDEIIELGGVQTPAGTDIAPIVQRLKVGDKLKVRVLRDGRALALEAVLTARISDEEIMQRRLVDKPAPDFSIKRLSDDATIDLAAIKGKVAVIGFFPPSCDACAGLLSALGPWAQKHDRDPVVVLGATPVEPAGLRSYVSRNPVVVPMGSMPIDGSDPQPYIADSKVATVTFAVIDSRGVVKLAAVLAPGSDDRVADVCVAAERALKQLKRH